MIIAFATFIASMFLVLLGLDVLTGRQCGDQPKTYWLGYVYAYVGVMGLSTVRYDIVTVKVVAVVALLALCLQAVRLAKKLKAKNAK